MRSILPQAMLISTILLGLAALVGGSAWVLMIRMPGISYAGAFAPLSPAEQESRSRLEAGVQRLAVDIGERHVWQPAGLRASADHIEDILRGLGYARREEVPSPLRGRRGHLDFRANALLRLGRS